MKHLRLVTALAVLASILVISAPARAADANLAPFGTASATSAENAGLGADKAIDGDPATRWSSAWSDPQSLTVDLGAAAAVSGVTLVWEPAYATGYQVALSLDGTTWNTVYETAAGDGGTDEIKGLTGTARYVRMTGLSRVGTYGYSLYELQVFGTFTEQAVTLGVPGADLPEAGTRTVPVRLNKPAGTEVTVRYTSVDGTAVAGSDYVAASGTLTFPPGTVEQTITLKGVDDGIHENAETFDLTLSDATPTGTLIPRATIPVTITDDDAAPIDGPQRVVDDFEAGVPGGLNGVSVAAADRPGAGAGNRAVSLTGGTRALAPAQDWSGFDGIAFWFKGTGSGERTTVVVTESGGEAWSAAFTDSVAGWRQVRVPFRDLTRPDGELSLAAVQSWGLTRAAGTVVLDDVVVYQQVRTIDAFDGEVPFTAAPGPGIFTFGSNGPDNPTLSIRADRPREGAPAGNKTLHADYNITGWGGIVHNVSYDTDPQDWSGFAGIRFWWYGQNLAPLPPNSGPRIFFEVKDGGANGEASELWNVSFTDDWQGWHLVELPFSQFQYRGDYQPVGGIDHVLTLTRAWGYAITLPAGKAGAIDLDELQVYGVAPLPPLALIDTAPPVVEVEEGQTATVKVVLTTPDGAPLPEPVTVRYATGAGTADPRNDYQATSGELAFPAGTASGTTKTFPVLTKKDRNGETAETVPISLRSDRAAVLSDLSTVVIRAHGLPYLNKALPLRVRVEDLLGRMTLDEKIGQMTQAERNALRKQSDIATYNLGSLLSGGGSVPTPNTPAAWADMIDAYQLRTRQTRLQIPFIYGVDAVHGHNNVIGATMLPHNVGLGATRSPALVERTGKVTATEVRATGVPWDFAPCLCVSRDERWGRSYESYGEDPALVTQLNTVITGMQGRDLTRNDTVLATAKHFVGDGGTTYGSSTTGSYTTDQGVTQLTPEELWSVHISPYVDAVERGVGTVMPSYSSVDFPGDEAGPVKMHGNAELITNVLKGQLGFDGFVISDWQAIDQLPGDYASDVRTSINAGLDMIMVPSQYTVFEQTLRAEVDAGRVPLSRIDDAVSRILRQKFRLGLFEKPYADRTNIAKVGGAEHRAVARDAAAKSQVLLKNSGNVLPLRKDAKVYVAGSNSDDLGNQLGGWSISWQGSSGNITSGTTILAGIRQVAPGATVTHSVDASAPTTGSDVGVVVVGERPYAEGVGDVGNGHTLRLNAADRTAIDRVCAAMPCAVLVVSGRPLVISDQLDAMDAVVASWLPGSEGAGVADVLFGDRPFTGRLPVTWPRSEDQLPINVGDATYDPQFAYGWGIRTDRPRERLLAVKADLAGARDPLAKAAALALEQAADPRRWNADGTVRDAAGVQTLTMVAVGLMGATPAGTYERVDTVVSVLRGLAQAELVRLGTRAPAGAVTATAEADHLLASGKPVQAGARLAYAYWWASSVR
jgi:beta-glucosidase